MKKDERWAVAYLSANAVLMSDHLPVVAQRDTLITAWGQILEGDAEKGLRGIVAVLKRTAFWNGNVIKAAEILGLD